MEYPIDRKGVFVFLTFTRHEFNGQWGGLPDLDYQTDKAKLLSTFNLTDARNVLLADDLTMEETGKNSFDSFMKTFPEQLENMDAENEDPGFLLFVLMTHGLENGGFILATPESDNPKQKFHPCVNCNCVGGNHIGGSQCYIRYITKDVLDKVDKVEQYKGIPKLFVIQTCRGTEKNVTAPGQADKSLSIAPSEIELFNLQYPDTFLFRPCVEGNGSWVGKPGTNMGSFLIANFCYALQELQKKANKFSADMESLLRLKGRAEGPHPIDDLVAMLCAENNEGGWLHNICQRTTSLASNIMITDKRASGDSPLDKQQPHYSSSLAYKFSCLKMLKTQWEIKDDYLKEWFEEITSPQPSS